MTAELSKDERETLRRLARASIESGLGGREVDVRLEDYAPALRERRGTFVTLHVDGTLRGCIGTLEPERAVVLDVVKNAYAAAFRDPRFPALTRPEFGRLEIHISILSLPEPMRFRSEDDLIGQLRPGVDGVVLEDGRYRGTFLPDVWETVADPAEFLRQLKRKAGLAPDYWSDSIRAQRYITESIS